MADAIDACQPGPGAPRVTFDGDDTALAIATFNALSLLGRGGLVIMRVMHESWCTITPDGKHCICRDDCRDETDAARARAKAAITRAKAKAQRQARRKNRGRK